jgi:hypothetical protein
MKILDFFLFLWVIFALLDPDPDPATQINADPCGSGHGSGSETLFLSKETLSRSIYIFILRWCIVRQRNPQARSYGLKNLYPSK